MLRRALLLLLLVASGAACAGSPAAAGCAEPTDLRAALRTISVAGDLHAQAPVPVPDLLPRQARSESYRVRYALDVSACAQQPLAALWVFRAGAPYRVWSDAGQPLPLLSAQSVPRPALARVRTAESPVHNGRIPALFGLPPGTRSVTLELQTLAYLPAGLVRVEVGPVEQLLPVQARAIEDVVAHADTAAEVVLVLGLLAFLLWLQRRGDRSLLWLAVACGLWGLRGLLYFAQAVDLEPTAFEQFNPLNVLLSSAALCASVLALVGRLTRRAAAILGAAALAGFVAIVLAQLAGRGALPARALALGTSFAMVTAVVGVVLRQRARISRWHVLILVGALGGLLGCAAHDLLVVAGALPPDEPSYVFWGFVAMLVGFSVMSGHYVASTLTRAERANEELEAHVRRKTEELEHSYAQLRERERDSVRTQERERLLRDMHDGLGAQLMTALRGVERGALAREEIARSLQDGLDELRLLMDSTDMGHYLPGALAAWRNRWDARLAAAGVALHWRIDESLDEVQLPGDTALQVLRVLQEAATNIVKHAGARNMVLDARVRDGRLRVEIRDDGRGLPAGDAGPGSRGLRNMAHRARQIGASLVIGPCGDGPGTCVRLELPLAA